MATEKKDNTSRNAAVATGLGSLGVMNIDLRKKVNEKHLRHLTGNIERRVRPGDVLVGSPTTSDVAVSEFVKDFKKSYKDARSSGKGIWKSLSHAKSNSYIAGPVSKIGDTKHSHAEYIIGKNSTVYIGGNTPKRLNSLMGENTHYTIMRPVNPPDKKLLKDVKHRIYSKGLAGSENYSFKNAISSQVKDWLLPKLRSSDRQKSDKVLAAESKIKSGHCASIGALSCKRTIGGKDAKNILPIDYMRSKDWKAVGSIGIQPKNLKTKFVNKLILGAPKRIVQGGAALAIAGGVYGASKAIQGMKKESSMDFVAFPKTAAAVIPKPNIVSRLWNAKANYLAARPGQIKQMATEGTRNVRKQFTSRLSPLREQARAGALRYKEISAQQAQMHADRTRQLNPLNKKINRLNQPGFVEQRLGNNRIGSWLQNMRGKRLDRLQQRAGDIESRFTQQSRRFATEKGQITRQQNALKPRYRKELTAARQEYKQGAQGVIDRSAQQTRDMGFEANMRGIGGRGAVIGGAVAIPLAAKGVYDYTHKGYNG